jgi:UDP-N-acetylmuramoyl-L-alanyl-D-glutamate--2,6-diaminopimelate ligase
MMTARAITLAELLRDFADAGDAAALVPAGLALDHRRIHRGDAFIALRGGTRHGLDFAADAAARGAAVVLYETPAPPPHLPVPAIAVPELRAKLGEIANRWYAAPTREMTVVGVTGTNGKTSTVQLIAQALAGAGLAVGTIGTLGAGLHGALVAGERTTPDVLATQQLIATMRAQGATHIAMEVSSHALEQGRVDGIAFDVAVFTNLTRDHLDYHGSMDAYFDAKAKLFAWPGLRAAVINLDDRAGHQLLKRVGPGVRVIATSAIGEPADLTATDVRTSAAGIAFTLHAPGGERTLASPLLGRFNVANLLAVAGTLYALDWDLSRIADTLATLTPVPGRMSRYGGAGGEPLIVVDYAHTPDALEQALTSLRAHTAGKLICVFGCGGDRDQGKRPQMGAIAERLADIAIVTDDNPRGEDGNAIVKQILAGVARPQTMQVERDRARAIAQAVALATPDDVVLIAGKGHEPYQEIRGELRHFDDGEHARRALAARA